MKPKHVWAILAIVFAAATLSSCSSSKLCHGSEKFIGCGSSTKAVMKNYKN